MSKSPIVRAGMTETLTQLIAQIKQLKVDERARLAECYKLPYDLRGQRIFSATIEAYEKVQALIESALAGIARPQPQTAGDLYLAAVDEWVGHVETCALDDCAQCVLLTNRVRLARKVWQNSEHKAAAGIARPSPRSEKLDDEEITTRPSGAEETEQGSPSRPLRAIKEK